jgi:hypothetical protein
MALISPAFHLCLVYPIFTACSPRRGMLEPHSFVTILSFCEWWEGFFMPIRVLLMQSDPTSAQAFSDYFLKRGDKVWKTAQIDQAEAVLKKEAPNLLFLDLHLPGNEWMEILTRVQQDHPKTRVIITNKHPDYRGIDRPQRGVQLFPSHSRYRSLIERGPKLEDEPGSSADKNGGCTKVQAADEWARVQPFTMVTSRMDRLKNISPPRG